MSTTSIQPFQRDRDTYDIIGAAMAVHRELGCGYLEAVYKGALAIEFRLRSIPFWPEVAELTPVHMSQVINYLRASGAQRGLLLNFGARSLEYRRVVWTANSHT